MTELLHCNEVVSACFAQTPEYQAKNLSQAQKDGERRIPVLLLRCTIGW